MLAGRLLKFWDTLKEAEDSHDPHERLAMEYGMVDANRLKSISNDLAYGRAIRDVFEFAAVFATIPE